MGMRSHVTDPYLLANGANHDRGNLADQRHLRIREAAYFLAEARGFAPGHELDDWLKAEKQIDASEMSRPG